MTLRPTKNGASIKHGQGLLWRFYAGSASGKIIKFRGTTIRELRIGFYLIDKMGVRVFAY